MLGSVSVNRGQPSVRTSTKKWRRLPRRGFGVTAPRRSQAIGNDRRFQRTISGPGVAGPRNSKLVAQSSAVNWPWTRHALESDATRYYVIPRNRCLSAHEETRHPTIKLASSRINAAFAGKRSTRTAGESLWPLRRLTETLSFELRLYRINYPFSKERLDERVPKISGAILPYSYETVKNRLEENRRMGTWSSSCWNNG